MAAKSLDSYKMDIISSDLTVLFQKTNRSPAEATRSLYFNAYTHLTRILGTYFSTIKAVAIDAARMQEVAATEEEVKQAQNLRGLFQCLKVDKNWNDVRFFDLAIMSLPPEDIKKEAAHLVLNHYKSYLMAYRMANSIKDGKEAFSFHCKQDREKILMVTEVTVNKDMSNFTCKDCLDLWIGFLVEALKIPKDCIQFCDARPGNSTILVFLVPQTFIEKTKVKLFKPNVLWVVKEQGILQVHIVGLFKVDLRETLHSVAALRIRDGLESGVDFMSLTKVCVLEVGLGSKYVHVFASEVGAKFIAKFASKWKKMFCAYGSCDEVMG